MLKGSAPSICFYLAGLFNESLKEGKLPDEWKISNITPIFKARDPLLVGKYRPISLLSLVSKLLALMSDLLENDFLSDRQFGYRPSSST